MVISGRLVISGRTYIDDDEKKQKQIMMKTIPLLLLNESKDEEAKKKCSCGGVYIPCIYSNYTHAR